VLLKGLATGTVGCRSSLAPREQIEKDGKIDKGMRLVKNAGVEMAST
jgi:hypothetical protein